MVTRAELVSARLSGIPIMELTVSIHYEDLKRIKEILASRRKVDFPSYPAQGQVFFQSDSSFGVTSPSTHMALDACMVCQNVTPPFIQYELFEVADGGDSWNSPPLYAVKPFWFKTPHGYVLVKVKSHE